MPIGGSPDYATWGKRALGGLIDFGPNIVITVIVEILYFRSLGNMQMQTYPDLSGLMSTMVFSLVLSLVLLAWQIYNRWHLGGKTG